MDIKPKFTPGPWKIDGLNGVITYSNGVICGFRYPFNIKDTQDEILSNAALIASAPEMFEILERINRVINFTPEFQAQLDAILQKARGE